MTLVKFIADYRGYLTNETYYQAGNEAELEDSQAATLAERGYVEIVEPPKEDKPATRKRGKK